MSTANIIRDLIEGPKLRRSKLMLFSHIVLIIVCGMIFGGFSWVFPALMKAVYFSLWVLYVVSIAILLDEREKLVKKNEELPESIDFIYIANMIIFGVYIYGWFFIKKCSNIEFP